MADESDQAGLLKLDFVRFFPHKFWISSWSEDEAYPDGFRYKVLSARDETVKTVEFVLLLQARDGTKQEMHRAAVGVDGADRYIRVFVEGRESEYGIDFEEQDFSEVRLPKEFETLVAERGWQIDDASN
jgi:hypothetical protein